MFDLQVLAMQGDVTRVMTFQLARETSNRTYPGDRRPRSASSAHAPRQRSRTRSRRWRRSTRSTCRCSPYYLEKLKSTPDGDGSLLDHSLVLYGSGMGNPNIHDHVNLPIVVAGGAAGKLKGGRHIKYAEPTPLANLHLTLLERVGVRMDTFADSQGKVDELLAL